MWSCKVQHRNPIVWQPSMHYLVPFLITESPDTFDNVLIIFQCTDSQVLGSAKKETDLVYIKEETPADKVCPDICLIIESTFKTTNIKEGEKSGKSITKGSKQYECQSDMSNHSRDELRTHKEKSQKALNK